MKTKGKVHFQCGYEDLCSHKNCMKCQRQIKPYNLRLSIAEQVVIEDFAMTDLAQTQKYNPEDLRLMQDVMRKIMHKVFKEEKNG